MRARRASRAVLCLVLAAVPLLILLAAVVLAFIAGAAGAILHLSFNVEIAPAAAAVATAFLAGGAVWLASIAADRGRRGR